MNVVFITYDGLCDPLGRSQIIPYIVGLSKAGHSYHILSSEKKANLLANKDEVSRILEEQNIKWTYRLYTKSPPILSTLNDIKGLRRELRKIVKEGNIEAVHCRGYVPCYIAFDMAGSYGIKTIFDMRGFWIDERIEGNIWNARNPVYQRLIRFLRKKEKKWFEGSDHVISLTNAGKQVILERFQTREERITIIPCCADELHFDPEKIVRENRDALKNDLGIGEFDKVLCYSGSVGTWYKAEAMMKQFGRLKKEGVFDKFLWITRESKDIIMKLADGHVSEEDLIVTSASRSEMPIYLSMADCGIFYIQPSFSKVASSPTKLGEMLQMGLPVICNSGVGDLDEFFKEQNLGICHNLQNDLIDPKKIEDLLKKNPSEIRNEGILAFSLNSGVEKYKSVLSRLEKKENWHCPSCGMDQVVRRQNYEEEHLLRCHICDLTFASSKPDEETLSHHYSQYSRDDYLSPITKKRYRELLDEFKDYSGPEMNILDVGCGMGFFLQEANELGWKTHGVEFTGESVEICRSKGIQMFEGDIRKIDFGDKKFDVITGFEIIEHIGEPNSFVKKISDLLNAGGLLYLTTPNFDSLNRRVLGQRWNAISYPEHLCYYNKHSLDQLLIEHGLKKNKVRTEGISPGRLIRSLRNQEMDFSDSNSSDEVLRRNIEGNTLLELAKRSANTVLNFFALGESLKSWYIRS